MALKVKTRGNAQPNGKPRVYISDHGQADSRWRDLLIADLLELCDCAVFYHEETAAEPEEAELPLEQMQLLVIPVTRALLTTENKTLQQDLPYALAHKMGVLPIMLEGGLVEPYAKAFGQLQFLDRTEQDSTARSYKEKLSAFLDAVLLNTEQAQKVRDAFDAYIFLSYRKVDRKYANDLMRLIHNAENFAEVAIWYDEYLTPGEDFNDTIQQALKKAPVFVLTVTPNLLTPGNYVLDYEYPAAIQHRKPVLPVEMEKTDLQLLQAAFQGIDQCESPEDAEALRHALNRCFQGVPLGSRKADPEHMYLMGLAYLNGIDVEVDRNRAADYIRRAALANHPAAVAKLAEMYTYGIGVARDWLKARLWRFVLHVILQAQFNRSAYCNRKRSIAPEDRRILKAYLDNLQEVLQKAPYAKQDRELTRWAEKELSRFIEQYKNIADPQAQEWIAEAMVLDFERNQGDKEKLIAHMQLLLQKEDSEKRKRLLIRAYLAKHGGYTYKGTNSQMEEMVRLCRQLVEQDNDPEEMLYLAEALHIYAENYNGNALLRWLIMLCDKKKLWRLKYWLRGKIPHNDWKYDQEAIALCQKVSENVQNVPAIRLLADICSDKAYALEKAEIRNLLLQAYEQMKQVYAYTADEEDLDRLRSLCWAWQLAAEDQTEEKLYAQRREALRKSASGDVACTGKKRWMLRYAIGLGDTAREQKLDTTGAWDSIVVALKGKFALYGNDIPDEGAFLKCDLRYRKRKEQEERSAVSDQDAWERQCWEDNIHQKKDLAAHAKSAWEKKGDLLAAKVYGDILSQWQEDEERSVEERFSLCVEAMNLFAQMTALDWRLHTWQNKKAPAYELKSTMDWFAGRLGSLMGKNPQVGERSGDKFNSLVTMSYLEALNALEQGDLLKAAEHSFRFEDQLPMADPTRAPMAQLYELRAKLLQTAPPEIREALLQKANACYELLKCPRVSLAVAMNNSRLAELALQRGDKDRARLLLEQTIHLDIPITAASLPVWDRINRQYQSILQGLAPKEAQRSKNRYIWRLEKYLQWEKDPQRMAQYLAMLPEGDVPDEHMIVAIMDYAFSDPAENVRPIISRILHQWLCDPARTEIANKAQLLRYQEECLEKEDSPENRRYFACGAVKLGMSEAEALAEDAVSLASWLGRLEKAKKLLLEIENQWTAEDQVLYNDLERILQEVHPEGNDKASREAHQLQYQQDHGEEIFKEELLRSSSSYEHLGIGKRARQERFEELMGMLRRIEAALDKNFSAGAYLFAYSFIEDFKKELQKHRLQKQGSRLQEKLAQLLNEQLKALPDQERKRELRPIAKILRNEGLTADSLLWLDRLFARETQAADPKDLVVYYDEYGNYYLSLGAYEKAEALLLQYVDGWEHRTKENMLGELAYLMEQFIENERWDTATVFYKKLLALVTRWMKEEAFPGDSLVRLRNITESIAYGQNARGKYYSDREIEKNFGPILDALDEFLKTDFDYRKERIFRDCYADSRRKVMVKRGLALARKMNLDGYFIKELKENLRWCRM